MPCESSYPAFDRLKMWFQWSKNIYDFLIINDNKAKILLEGEPEAEVLAEEL